MAGISEIKLEVISVTKKYADGRINIFPGIEEYYTVAEIFKKYFSDEEFFSVAPYFFECYKSKSDKGFVVNVNNREIKIENKEHTDLCKKLIHECKEKGIVLKIK